VRRPSLSRSSHNEREVIMAGRTADVVVIGGGVNGVSIAMHLAKRGAGKVVLLEKGHLASGATGRSGAADSRYGQASRALTIMRPETSIR
jgi:glycine/D-amino acid oxidase-like deaminating enzyme